MAKRLKIPAETTTVWEQDDTEWRGVIVTESVYRPMKQVVNAVQEWTEEIENRVRPRGFSVTERKLYDKNQVLLKIIKQLNTINKKNN